MLIEFYGIPGSGKTTISKALQERDSMFVYLHTSPRSEIIRLVPWFILKNPKKALFWFWELFNESVKCNFGTFFRYKLHLLLISIAQYQKASKSSKNIYLIDEGLLQRILAIYENKLSREEVERCFKYIPKVDIAVVVENKPTEFYRFKESPHRHESPRLHLGGRYFKNWMEIVRQNDEVIRKVIRDTHKTVVFCDGSAGVNNCLDKIYEAINDNSKNR